MWKGTDVEMVLVEAGEGCAGKGTGEERGKGGERKRREGREKGRSGRNEGRRGRGQVEAVEARDGCRKRGWGMRSRAS